MKKKQLKEHRQKSLPEVEKIVREQRKKLADLNFDVGTSKTKSAKEIRDLKKSIAQLLTIKAEIEKVDKQE